MFYDPTTLASITALLATALREEYGIDPEPLYQKAGIPLGTLTDSRERIPLSNIRTLWALSLEASGDDTIGLKAGKYAKPTDFYAFGYSWLASSNLLGGMRRLSRYYHLMSTSSVEVSIVETADSYALSAIFPDESKSPPKQGIDCGMTAILALCDIVTEERICPIRVELTCPASVHPDAYREALRAPIIFDAKIGTFHFDKETILAPLRHGTPDIARATDKIAEQYIETLDPAKVASKVRRLLIDMLPSGNVDQERVSNRLNRSTSTLQRQLQSEGVSYRDVLESTQRSLAETYLQEKRHSHAQIAYLLGFSEQSNFSRAFKRWTSVSPRQYQDSKTKD